MSIVFLDIDGPVIPSGCYIAFGPMASFDHKFSPICTALVNMLCEFGPKIVFNTTHNTNPGLLKADAIREGINPEYIHEDSHTKYPEMPRLDAINEWLARHPKEINWAALDDAKINHVNAVRVNPDAGIIMTDIERAHRNLKIIKPLPLLLI